MASVDRQKRCSSCSALEGPGGKSKKKNFHTQISEVKSPLGENLVYAVLNIYSGDMATDHPLRLRRTVPKISSRAAVKENMLSDRFTLVLYQETHSFKVEFLVPFDLRLDECTSIAGHARRRVDGPYSYYFLGVWEL